MLPWNLICDLFLTRVRRSHQILVHIDLGISVCDGHGYTFLRMSYSNFHLNNLNTSLYTDSSVSCTSYLNNLNSLCSEVPTPDIVTLLFHFFIFLPFDSNNLTYFSCAIHHSPSHIPWDREEFEDGTSFISVASLAG